MEFEGNNINIRKMDIFYSQVYTIKMNLNLYKHQYHKGWNLYDLVTKKTKLNYKYSMYIIEFHMISIVLRTSIHGPP